MKTQARPCDDYRPYRAGGMGVAPACQCGWDLTEHPVGRHVQTPWRPITLASPKDVAWMRICYFSAAQLSTCAKRQYFSVVLSADGSVAGIGYNGGPSGMKHCKDGGCPRLREGSAGGSNYDNCIAVHAEENALIRSSPERRAGGTLYVNGPPCFGCAKKICNGGVKRVVVVHDDGYADAARSYDFMKDAGLKVVVLDPDLFSEFKEQG